MVRDRVTIRVRNRVSKHGRRGARMIFSNGGQIRVLVRNTPSGVQGRDPGDGLGVLAP